MATIRSKILVHGNSVFLQYPGGAGPEYTADHQMDQVSNNAFTDITGERQGPGVVFRGIAGNGNFFHVSIPSPTVVPVYSPDVIISGGDPPPDPPDPHHYTVAFPQLLNVFVEITTDPQVRLGEVYAFDGRNIVPEFPKRPSSTSSGQHVFNLSSPYLVQSGLGLSFHVAFAGDGNITFHSAGAEFQMTGLP